MYANCLGNINMYSLQIYSHVDVKKMGENKHNSKVNLGY